MTESEDEERIGLRRVLGLTGLDETSMFAADGSTPLMIEVDVGDERFALPYSSLMEARLIGVRELQLSTPSRTVVVQGNGLLPLLVGLCNHRLTRLRATPHGTKESSSPRIDRVMVAPRDAESS